MINLNTNISSLTAQRSMSNSTRLLNQAIERMSTGFKINHASDNAANYSISTNMTTKIGAYQVAEENVTSGLDLLSTANGSLDLISDKLSRLRALAEQASNGTYGKQSLEAMNREASSIVDEINRVYSTTEYNGTKLFGHSGRFIEDINRRDTSKMTTLESVDETQTLTSGVYSISSAEELAKLARMSNSANIQGAEFVLANDIDLSEYSTGRGWVSIGSENWSRKHFTGIFDGNGYVISNLYINTPSSNNRGLFGCAEGEIKNLGLENVDVTANLCVSGLVGVSAQDINDITDTKLTIENCYVKGGKINSKGEAGGLVGNMRSKLETIKSCYTDVTVEADETSANSVGGLIGRMNSNSIKGALVENCYALGDVSAQSAVGGLIGQSYSETTIKNCYAEGNVQGTNAYVGGLIGSVYANNTISNCYATGNVYSKNVYVGGLLGDIDGGLVKYCYSTGNVTALRQVGGLIGKNGKNKLTVEDCYSSGVVVSPSLSGGILGICLSSGTVDIKNSYVLGKSDKIQGIFVGSGGANSTIDGCYYDSYYEESGKKFVYGLANDNENIKNVQSYSGKVPFRLNSVDINLQVGINDKESSSLDLTTSFLIREVNDLYSISLDNDEYMNKIDELINKLSAKQTEFGSVQNRLESALDEISTQYDNIVSSRSTLRDADVAEVSSNYIRQQILQQASATLMATANQSPALALQLI